MSQIGAAPLSDGNVPIVCFYLFITMMWGFIKFLFNKSLKKKETMKTHSNDANTNPNFKMLVKSTFNSFWTIGTSVTAGCLR